MPFMLKGIADVEFVNLHESVGAKEVGTGLPAINRIPDMEFVNYLLYRIYQSSYFPGSQKVFAELQNAYGLNYAQYKLWLSKFILRFQNDRNRKTPHPRVFADGRVDVMRGNGGSLTSITNTSYTILEMQSILLDVGNMSEINMIKTDGVLFGNFHHAYAELFPDVK